VAQGDVSLLEDPVAQELLGSRSIAKLAYTWTDGSPRVVPIWFHWDGQAVVLGSPPAAPKLKALQHDPRVSVTIDTGEWPYHVVYVRGRATVEMKDGVVPEYAAAAERYLGPDAGRGWVDSIRDQPMAKISVAPEWVGVLDFETRFPSAISS